MKIKLDSPATVATNFGPLQATHVVHSFALDSGRDVVTSSVQYGVEVDGVFQALPGADAVVNITGDDFKSLVRDGNFSSQDVRAAHVRIIDRQRAAHEVVEHVTTATSEPTVALQPAVAPGPVGSAVAGPVIGG